jgi:hypothetical protein
MMEVHRKKNGMKNVSGFSLVSPFQALLPKTVGTDIVL